MSEPWIVVHHPKPSQRARKLINALVTSILRSRQHALMSPRLLLLTFTGRKSGKEFTTPIRYKQLGETLIVKIMLEYSWWKNLRDQPNVHVLLRGRERTGRAEVLPPVDGIVTVRIHLQAESD